MNIDQSLDELKTNVQHIQTSVNCISDKIEENKSKCDALTTKIDNIIINLRLIILSNIPLMLDK